MRQKFLLFFIVCCMSLSVMAQMDPYPTYPNPVLWTDVPDPDVICVDGNFYLVTTTMHQFPGVPIMRSKDLINWETIGYVVDKLTDSPRYDMQGGTIYGRGQWATSLKYHNGKFYVLFAPNEMGDMGRSYIYSAVDPAGPWELVSRLPHFHDCSLLFDDDGRVYVVYGTGELCELKPDLSGIIEGSHMKIFEREEDEKGLLEGSRMVKHNGKYYLLMISQVWGPGRHRREVCYRADDIHGPYEKNVILQSDLGGFPYVGQGTIVDSKDGDWYGVIFQDHGAVGRVITVMPCRWLDGWPMLGDEYGKVPENMRPVVKGQPVTPLMISDNFDSLTLGLQWQWNHNPVDAAWSLTERPGYLRLKTSRMADNIYLAPNTISQRMMGPYCSAEVELDVSHIKEGDRAGFCAFNGHSGVLTITKKGKKYLLTMTEEVINMDGQEKQVTNVEVTERERIEFKQGTIWLRIDGDFTLNRDIAQFYYSFDGGQQWHRIGPDYKMRFDYQRFFMGTRYAIFCYATRRKGGYVDVGGFNCEIKEK